MGCTSWSLSLVRVSKRVFVHAVGSEVMASRTSSVVACVLKVAACLPAAIVAAYEDDLRASVKLIACVDVVVVVNVQLILVSVSLAPASDDIHKISVAQKVIVAFITNVLSLKCFQGVVVAPLQSARGPIRWASVFLVSGHCHG